MHAFWHGLGYSLSSLLLVYNFPTPCRPSSPFFTLTLFFCLFFLFCCVVAHFPILCFSPSVCCTVLYTVDHRFPPPPFNSGNSPGGSRLQHCRQSEFVLLPRLTLCHVDHKEEMAAILKQLALNCHAPYVIALPSWPYFWSVLLLF